MFPAPKAATSTTKPIRTTNAVTANADIVVEEKRREENRDAAGIGRVWHEGIMYVRAEVNFVALARRMVGCTDLEFSHRLLTHRNCRFYN